MIRYVARAKIIKAKAHPSRLLIIDELNKQERCVGELAEMVGSDASTVSKHLSVLKNAGLVSEEKRGNCVYYSLHCACMLDFVDCVEDVLVANADEQKQMLKSCKR